MNEVEKQVVKNFKENNKNNDEYAYLTDEEILRINPATVYDYVDYYNDLILEEKQKIKGCLECIQNLENETNFDYIRRKENLEYIKEEKTSIISSQKKIDEYKLKRDEYLKQIDKDYIR